MRSSPLGRAALYGRRVRGGTAVAWLSGFFSAVTMVGLLLLLGLAVGLFASGGSILLSPAAAAVVKPWTQLAPGSMEYQHSGLIPLAYRLEGTWHGEALQAACRWIPWLRSNESCLLTLLSAALFLAAVRAVSEFLLARSAHQAAERTAGRLRLDLQQQARRLGGSALIDQPHPSIFELFNDRIETVRQSLADRWSLLPLAVFQSGGCLLIALLIDPWLALAGVLLSTVGWFLWMAFQHRAQRHQEVLGEQADQQFSDLEAYLEKSRLLGGCLLEESPGQPFQQSLGRYQQLAQALNTVYVAERPMVEFTVLAGVIVVTALAGVNALRDPPRITLAEITVLFAALWSAWDPLRRLVRLRWEADESEQAAAEVFAYLDREPHVGQVPRAKPLRQVTRDVRLAHVTLADRTGHRLLDDVSLRIAAGSRVVIVASDEHTPLALLGLLPRCYDPAAGRVLFDGHDIRHATLESLRRETAMVSPTGLLRNISVADNISWGDPKFAPRHITRAAKWAQAYSFIQQLPHGFSTIIDDDVHRFTPSEALRIDLARALLREPSIIVLEEPPEDLDPQTAELVDEAIAKVSKDRTLVTVTARLSTLRRADRIFLFHQGKLFAEGTHTELLQSCDLYRHLQYLRFNEFRNSTPQPQPVAAEEV